jgi:Flp pilus assembly protein TadG
MKKFRISRLRTLLRSERGQAGLLLVIVTTASVAFAGVAIESGHIYYARQLLVASTDAAALAGAQVMPNITQAKTNVNTYSSISGGLNQSALLQNAQITATNFTCSATVGSSLGVPCAAPSSGSCSGSATGCNELAVTQTAQVPLWFGGVIGIPRMNISVTATAATAGGMNKPWNIIVLMDTTGSMGDPDSGKQCSGSQESCALAGMRALLSDLYPCAQNTTCSGTGVQAVDTVSLYVFPAVTTGTASNDYTKGAGNPTIVPYSFPNASPAYTSGAPGSNLINGLGTYEITGFDNDYLTSDEATSLNPSSDIVKASGGVSGYSGLQTPGGEGTYYAQAIYAAQAELETEQAANLRLGIQSQNAMIILSDGDANACNTNANSKAGGNVCGSGKSSEITAAAGTLNGTGSNTSVVYPSALGQCGQAVAAAQYATAQGTTVYTIGYGAEVSGGCTTDQQYTATSLSGWPNVTYGKQPCGALAAMASTPADFYSDDGDSCAATDTTNANFTQLTQIFRAIISNLTGARLVPNGT